MHLVILFGARWRRGLFDHTATRWLYFHFLFFGLQTTLASDCFLNLVFTVSYVVDSWRH